MKFISIVFLPVLFFSACSMQSVEPPKVGEPYPDLELFDETGASVKLSDFRGKVTLLNAVSTSCGVCQGLSGADRYGPFGFVMPGTSVSSIESYLSRYAPRAARDPELQIIQIVFFGRDTNPPTAAELREWSQHFHLRERGIVVLGAPMGVSQTIGRKLVPGFQLLDRNFVLRSDSTGISPRSNFTGQLLPKTAALLQARSH